MNDTLIIARPDGRQVALRRRARMAISLGLALSTALAAMPLRFTSAASATMPVIDWNRRIDDALAAAGNVDAIASELAGVSASSPELTEARIRVAIEQGDLPAVVRLLSAAVTARPALLRRLAYFQELVGAEDAARQTLGVAAAATADSPLASEIALRLAALCFDQGRPAEGLTMLDRVAKAGSVEARRAGIVAYLYGQDASAAKYLQQHPSDDVAILLLEGNAALKAGESSAAATAFTQAFELAQKPADRLYAQERLIASARQAGTLSALADDWLKDAHLPAERLLPLATVLRELNRVPALLEWWRTNAVRPDAADVLLSTRVVDEVLGAARSAGKTGDAAAICQELLTRHPDDPKWLSATLRALLNMNRRAEADRLLDDRIAAANTPGELERLCLLARSLARDAVAIRAAKRVATFNDEAAITGRLLEASIAQRSGDRPRAVELLHACVPLALSQPGGLPKVVSALESAGLDDEAIALLEQSAGRTASDDTSGRLASLLLKVKRPADAMQILERLVHSESSAAVRAQAGQRLLQAAQAADALPRLIAELRDRLGTGKGDLQDLSLLVDAYLRQKDVTSAAATLRETKLLDAAARLSRLAVLFLRANNDDAAADVFRQLVTADPDNAAETLERLASVDLNRGRADEAAAAIGQIAKLAGDGPASNELMAGVYDRLGRRAEAAAGYRRALAANPDNADDWLLWATALSKDGQSARACGRLQVLCGSTLNDNVFATAADGLLNLAAPATSLRAVRRDAILRAAQSPQKTMLYHVIADLSDEIQDSSAVVRATDASVSISAEERPERLRELMDIASKKRMVDAAIECGRSLLALGDDFPPQLFLQLGEQLIIAGRKSDAAQAFVRAAETSDPEWVAVHASALYEQYDEPQAALDALLPSAERLSADANYRESVARLCQTVGQSDAAFENYLAATEIGAHEVAIDKPPTTIDRPSRPTTQRAATVPIVFGFGPSRQASDFTRVAAGATTTAVTPSQRARLIVLLKSTVASILADVPADATEPPARLDAVADALRRASFAFCCTEDADAVDHDLIARWPASDAVRRRAIDARTSAGLLTLASAFAARERIDPGESVREALRIAATQPSLDPTSSREVTAASAAQSLPNLMMHGRRDEAKTLLGRVPFLPAMSPTAEDDSRAPDSTEPYEVLVKVAATLGDAATATKWAIFWLDAELSHDTSSGQSATRTASSAAGQPSATRRSAIADRARDIITGCWPSLTADGRAKFTDRFVTHLANVDDAVARATMSLYALELSSAQDRPLANAARIAKEALAAREGDPLDIAMRVVAFTPADDRPAILRLAIGSLPAESQLQFLAGVVERLGSPPDAATSEAIETAARQAPAGQVVTWRDWYLRDNQRPAVLALADAYVRVATVKTPTLADAAMLTAAACAFSANGEPARADAAAARAIDAIRAPAPADPKKPTSFDFSRPPPGPTTLLRLAVASLSTDARSRLLAHLQTPVPDAPSVGASADRSAAAELVWRRLLSSIVLEANGRRSDALVALREAFATDATDSPTAHAYLDRLNLDGRNAEIAAAFATRVAGAEGDGAQYQTATGHALQELLRWREVRAFGRSSPAAAVDMAAQMAAADPQGLAASLRSLLIALHLSHGYLPFPRAPGVGGLQSEPPRGELDPPSWLIEQAAGWPGSADDMLRAIRLLPESGHRSPFAEVPGWLSIALTRGASDARRREDILASLMPVAAAHLLTPAERQLIAGIAMLPGARVPQSLLDELWPAALADRSGIELTTLARALAAQSDPHVASLQAWADALRPPAGGSAALPFGDASDAALADRLTRLASVNPAEAEAELTMLRAAGRARDNLERTNALWVRLAAERGDVATFSVRLASFLRGSAWRRLSAVPSLISNTPPRAAFDLRSILPERVDDAPRRRALLNAAEQSLSDAIGKWPSDTDLVRQMSAIGQWAVTHDERDIAEAIFTRVKPIAEAQGVGEHQLWVADLADQLGYSDVSTAVGVRLLEQRCLPVPRIVPLIVTLTKQGQSDLARKLAADAAKYCNQRSLTSAIPKAQPGGD